MYRFFELGLQSNIGDYIDLSRENFHHAVKVLRLRQGAEIIVSDGLCRDYLCVIETLSSMNVRVKVARISQNNAEMSYEITVFQAWPKNRKLDFVVQKAVELGAFAINMFSSERSVPQLEVAASKKKLEHLRGISEASAKQSKRGKIPAITEFESISDIDFSSYDINFYADEKESKNGLHELISRIKQSCSMRVAFLIGPEGGFSDAERVFFANNNILSVSLGKRVLRTETAAMYVLSCLSFCLEEI